MYGSSRVGPSALFPLQDGAVGDEEDWGPTWVLSPSGELGPCLHGLPIASGAMIRGWQGRKVHVTDGEAKDSVDETFLSMVKAANDSIRNVYSQSCVQEEFEP